MGLLDTVAAKFGFARKPPLRAHPGYAAAEMSRLTSSLVAETQFINTTLRYQLRTLRARSRQAAQNNPFARRFAQMVVDNVCGPDPFAFEGKVKTARGKFDEQANDKIEDAWQSWGKPGNCEVTGKWSWSATQRMIVRSLAIDGELLLRKLTGPEYGKHAYRLQILDVDRLWELKNASLDNGGAIHAGVEVDANGKPTAYHLLKRKPSQWQAGGYSAETERYPADEIVHVFMPEFAEQVRGVPWMYAALLNLVHLGAFEEAAVIAARIGASNMGFIESPDGGKTLAEGQGTDSTGNPQIVNEPGSFQFLPPGYQVGQGWNPKYPDAAVEPFIKACLRGVSAGIGVAYHNLANDLEGVNYSSARIGELDERDSWMSIQSFVIEHLHQPLYESWLQMQLINGVLPFESARADKYYAVHWQGRRWQWIDPLKEVGAAIEAVDARLKSRTRVVAEMGEDFEDVLEEIAAEEALAKEKNVDLVNVKPKASGVVPEPGDSRDGSPGTALLRKDRTRAAARVEGGSP